MKTKKWSERNTKIAPLSETKVNQGDWNNLDASAQSTDLRFLRFRKV